MAEKIRVLVVDDSGFVVASVTRKLQADPAIEVVGSARNGIEAIEKVKSLAPDVVTLDVVMPEMDGLTALGHIMAECPTPVVMLSALTSENAETTIRALEIGAVDFFLKPSAVRPDGEGTADDTLTAKVKMAAKVDVRPRMPAAVPGNGAHQDRKAPAVHVPFSKLVVIGSSTGGPRALMQLIPALPADIPAAILVVQHMPPVFTRSLSERLNQASQIKVSEAQEGSRISRGQALLAPGDYHMVIGDGGRIILNQNPPVQGVRPSVDVTMRSVAEVYRGACVGVVLTGMGSDGTDGASRIKAAGGRILAQDEATSAIYGMPMSVARAGHADKILPLPEIAAEIVKVCEN